MNRVASFLLGLSVLVAATASTNVARADVPPMCSSFDDAVNCDKADLDKACPSGGKCVEVQCEANGDFNSEPLYKCMTCPVTIEDTDGVCDGPATFGKACGDGGTCQKAASWCPSTDKFIECFKPSTDEPTNAAGSGGEAGSGQAGSEQTAGSAGSGETAGTSGQPTSTSSEDSSGGCAVSPVQRRGALAGGITLLGMAALMFERRRRGLFVQTVSRLDRLADPLDAMRRALFLSVQRLPILGVVLARRDLRLMTQTSAGVLVTFALTLLAPGVLFVMGPALFGVAHVASDLRYLVLRRSVPRAWQWTVLLASAALILSRAVEVARPALLPYAAIEALVGWGWAIAGVIAGALSVKRPSRIAFIAPAFVWVLCEALARPELARLLFAFGHNVIAIGLWALLFRRRRAFALPALAMAALGGWLLASGEALSWVRFDGPWARKLVDEALAAAAPLSQRAALGLGLSFVFLQSIHYSVWVSWVPQEDTRGEGTLSFRMSLRALLRDFGPAVLGVITLLALLVIGGSLISPHRTRYLYLTIASFHGYLEVAALAFLLGRGGLSAPASGEAERAA